MGGGCIFKTGGALIVQQSVNREGNNNKQPLQELLDLIKEINISIVIA